MPKARSSKRNAKGFPDFVLPQLATLVDQPPEGPQWVREIKFDGYRMLCRRAGSRVEIVSRNGNDWTARFPSLVEAAQKLKAQSFLIDGEVVVLNDKGISSFALMQDAMARKSDTAAVFYVFDLLHLDGVDLMPRPFVERKQRLAQLVPKSRKIILSDHSSGDGAKMLANACAVGLEGIRSKRHDAPYQPGRGLDWQKSKCLKRQEFLVIGYQDRSNAKNDFGSLILGAYEGGELVHVGQVGTGWNDRTRKAIYAQFKNLRIATPGVDVKDASIHWLKPRLIAEVAFVEWTNDGSLRHPSFQGLREDKSPRDVVIERPAKIPGLRGGGSWRRRKS